MRLAERAAEHREVLAEHEHQPAVHGPPAGNRAVARDLLPGHPETRGAVLHETVPIIERAGPEPQVHTLPGGQPVLLVLSPEPPPPTAPPGPAPPALATLSSLLKGK